MLTHVYYGQTLFYKLLCFLLLHLPEVRDPFDSLRFLEFLVLVMFFSLIFLKLQFSELIFEKSPIWKAENKVSYENELKSLRFF